MCGEWGMTGWKGWWNCDNSSSISNLDGNSVSTESRVGWWVRNSPQYWRGWSDRACSGSQSNPIANWSKAGKTSCERFGLKDHWSLRNSIISKTPKTIVIQANFRMSSQLYADVLNAAGESWARSRNDQIMKKWSMDEAIAVYLFYVTGLPFILHQYAAWSNAFTQEQEPGIGSIESWVRDCPSHPSGWESASGAWIRSCERGWNPTLE